MIRYVVVEHVTTQEKNFLNVSRWETSKHPRHFCFRLSKGWVNKVVTISSTHILFFYSEPGEKSKFDKQDGNFGDNEGYNIARITVTLCPAHTHTHTHTHTQHTQLVVGGVRGAG